MPDDVVPVPIADGTVRRLFEEPEFRVTKRGYHPDDVVAFLDGIGTRTVNLIERLQAAEKAAEATQAELDDHRLRAEQAESSRELFERTLVLAEETAEAAVADAQDRAARIEAEAQGNAEHMVGETRLRIERMMDAARADAQRVYADERQAAAETTALARSESDQLETLRLAVAAETMALEEVRNELRRRIRGVATDLLGVAESADGLGTPVTRGIPEVVARQVQTYIEQEASVPRPEGSTPAITPSTPPEGTTATDGGAELDSLPPPPPPPPPAPAAEPVAPSTVDAIDLVAGEHDPVTVVAEDQAKAPDRPEDAFDQFMSDEIEDEPSRTWILT